MEAACDILVSLPEAYGCALRMRIAGNDQPCNQVFASQTGACPVSCTDLRSFSVSSGCENGWLARAASITRRQVQIIAT